MILSSNLGGIASPIIVRMKLSVVPGGNFISSGIEDTIKVSNKVSTLASEYVPSGSI